MGRSLIQTANQSSQVVAENSIISLGSVQRRFGCNLRLSGNGIEIIGEGYYTVDCNVSIVPSAEGLVTIALFNNGVQIPGAIAYQTAGAGGDSINVGLNTTIRQACCCDSADNLTCVLLTGPGTVQNISMRVVKE